MFKQPRDGKQNQWWLALLLISFIGVLWVPFFDGIGPTPWGALSFFGYQFPWVIGAIVTALVYFKGALKPLAIRHHHREGRRQ